jgi:polyphosphate glucokinase
MVQRHENLTTAALDIGGTGIKAMLLDGNGKPISEREREPTPNPATPESMLRVMRL